MEPLDRIVMAVSSLRRMSEHLVASPDAWAKEVLRARVGNIRKQYVRIVRAVAEMQQTMTNAQIVAALETRLNFVNATPAEFRDGIRPIGRNILNYFHANTHPGPYYTMLAPSDESNEDTKVFPHVMVSVVPYKTAAQQMLDILPEVL